MQAKLDSLNMDLKPKKPRTEKQDVWAKELGKRTAEFKKAKKERLNQVENKKNNDDGFIKQVEKRSEELKKGKNEKLENINDESIVSNSNNNLSTNSSSRNNNKYFYTTITIIGLSIFIGLTYKYRDKLYGGPNAPPVKLDNRDIIKKDRETQTKSDENSINWIKPKSKILTMD